MLVPILLNTRRDRSRRIRDEETACEPEVVTCERAIVAKPEVEIWRRTDFSIRRTRLPIRPPIHQSVYLAPLRSFNELRSKVGQSAQLLPV